MCSGAIQRIVNGCMLIANRFKTYFFRGLAVLLPTMLTIWIFIWGYRFIQDNISIYINRGIVRLIVFFEGQGVEEAMIDFWVKGAGSIAGFVLALIGVCVFGAILASVVGRTLWRLVERFIMSTPFLKKVYPYVKQITDFLLTQDKISFSRVVAFEHPRKGVWVIGLVTGSGLKRVAEKNGKEFLTVFLPTSPTPFTGFVIMVPREEVIDLDISIEEAIRFIISGGVVAPGARLDEKGTLFMPENSVEKI